MHGSAPDRTSTDSTSTDRTTPDGRTRLLRRLVLVALAAGLVGPAVLVAAADPGPTGAGQERATGMMPADSPDAAVQVAPAGAPAYATTTTTLEGVDVARYQHPSGGGGDLDWSAVAGSGQAFAVVKATEDGYVNPYFSSDIRDAHAAGLVVGGYAFARPASSAVAQADAFTHVLGTLPAPSLPPVLDLEDDGGLSTSALVAWTHAFLDRVQATTGRIPMIYSGPSFWAYEMGGDEGFTGYPLWEAHYTTAAAPAAMGGWPTYALWQYTSSGSVPGITGNVDRDRFRGTREQLAGLGWPATQSRSAIDAKFAALGGSSGPLGAPVGSLVSVPGGTAQQYRSGTVYYSASTGAHAVYGAVLSRYLALGGPGALGLPTSDEVDARGVPGGRVNTFVRGNVYWTAAYGAHGVYGAVLERYLADGGCAVLGAPTADEAAAPGGRVSTFTAGSVYWSPATGAHTVVGGIRDRYLALGGPAALGLPTTQELDVNGVPGARVSIFGAGNVYWSRTTGAHAVYGAIRDRYLAGGGAAALGLPVADEAAAPGGRVSRFTTSDVYWSPSYGAHVVLGAVRDEYLALAGPTYVGLPVADEADVPGVPGARRGLFERATVYWSPATGAHEVHGGIRSAYDAAGGPAGSGLGLPVRDEYSVTGGRRSDFAHGYATWSSSTGTVTLVRQ